MIVAPCVQALICVAIGLIFRGAVAKGARYTGAGIDAAFQSAGLSTVFSVL